LLGVHNHCKYRWEAGTQSEKATRAMKNGKRVA
jgi:hypothetical protein